MRHGKDVPRGRGRRGGLGPRPTRGVRGGDWAMLLLAVALWGLATGSPTMDASDPSPGPPVGVTTEPNADPSARADEPAAQAAADTDQRNRRTDADPPLSTALKP